MNNLVLHYAPDNASLIIRLALNELGLPYSTRLVDRAANAQRAPDYLKLNPAGRIPVLETPDGPIFETAAILLWLEEHSPGLMPKEGSDRATSLKWLIYLATTLHPALMTLFYTERFGPKSAVPEMQSRTIERICDQLTLLDQAINGPYLVGAAPTLPDFYLAPLLRWAVLYPIDGPDWCDLAKWPALYNLAQTIETRPASLSAAQAEGLGTTPFSSPVYASPPEGSAT